MNPIFQKEIDKLDGIFNELVNSSPIDRVLIPSKGGVYVFSEGSKFLYVGRAKNLRRRVAGHSTPSSKDAPFAFRLAREVTGNMKATYTQSGSRKELHKKSDFAEAYAAAKKRIKIMDVRVAVEEDPIGQTLLEIYVATALVTPYNDFETH